MNPPRPHVSSLAGQIVPLEITSLQSRLTQGNPVFLDYIHFSSAPRPPRLVTASASPEGEGVVLADGNYAIGQMETVSAIPALGYTFAYWSEGGNIVSVSPEYAFTVSGPRALVAHFVASPAQPLLTGMTVSNSEFQSVVVSPPFSSGVVIQASPDLQHWMNISTNEGFGATSLLTDPISPGQPARFYRAVQSP